MNFILRIFFPAKWRKRKENARAIAKSISAWDDAFERAYR